MLLGIPGGLGAERLDHGCIRPLWPGAQLRHGSRRLHHLPHALVGLRFLVPKLPIAVNLPRIVQRATAEDHLESVGRHVGGQHQ